MMRSEKQTLSVDSMGKVERLNEAAATAAGLTNGHVRSEHTSSSVDSTSDVARSSAEAATADGAENGDAGTIRWRDVARAVRHVRGPSGGVAQLVEMLDTSGAALRFANYTMDQALALNRTMNLPPDPNKLSAQQTAVLAGKPAPCATDLVASGCSNFTGGTVTPESLADKISAPLPSVQAFLGGASRLTCQELCQKALDAIPSGGRPPKSWVAAQRVGGTLYWSTDASPGKLVAMAEGAETTAGASPDANVTGGAAHPSGQGGSTADPGGNRTWPVLEVAEEVCAIFGVYPFVDTSPGGLLDGGGGAGGVRLETSYQCQSYATYKIPCTCYSKASYHLNADLNLIWVFVHLWNVVYQMNLHSFNAIIWAPLIMKRMHNDPLLVQKMTELHTKVATADVEICYDIFYHFVNPNVLGYTWRTEKFYFTLSGTQMDLVGKIITWFHEVAHMGPIYADDVHPYGFSGALGHSAADAIRNADSYEIYINRIMGSPVHSTNR